jgi:two-component system nitrate/nitrite response regulator NarL
MTPIRTILVEDETLLRTLLRKGLEADGGFEIIGEAENGVDGLRLCKALNPELVLLDIRLPEMDGVEVAEKLRSEHNEIKIVILSSRQDPVTLRRALEQGVEGVVDKRSHLEDVIEAIVMVRNGKRAYSKAALEILSSMAFKEASGVALSSREKEILRRISRGLTNRATAVELSISEFTVKTHRQNIQRKLDIHDTAGLTRYAIEEGLA